MASTSFPVYVSYSQLCVFLSSLQHPFNDWLQVHVDQGFSWRPGSVSFRSLVEDGQHLVELGVSKHPVEISKNAVRVIEVPFDIPFDGNIEIASISESVPVSIASGPYLLRCEFFGKNENAVFPVRLIFISANSREFRVVRADNELRPPHELVTVVDAAK